MVFKISLITILAIAAYVQGTTIHPNSGCIDVNSSPVCAGGSISVDGGSATIYAEFNGADTGDQVVSAGCQLEASWPAYYGEIYFGANNCLYDASSNLIDGQCCLASTGGAQVVNHTTPRTERPNCLQHRR